MSVTPNGLKWYTGKHTTLLTIPECYTGKQYHSRTVPCYTSEQYNAKRTVPECYTSKQYNATDATPTNNTMAWIVPECYTSKQYNSILFRNATPATELAMQWYGLFCNATPANNTMVHQQTIQHYRLSHNATLANSTMVQIAAKWYNGK